MLLQIKVYLIAVIYFFGALFMILFPPRNYVISGSKIRTVRSANDKLLQYPLYVNYNMLMEVAQKMAVNEEEVVRVVHLSPPTAENRSLVALELHSDQQTRKPGILIIGALNAMAWGAPNAILELADKLLHDANYQTPFFSDYDWYLLPMANPDGIHFTKSLQSLTPIETNQWMRNITARTSTRPLKWHKNVDKEGISVCFGTNVNRNFAYHWQDDVRKTPERCSQYYPGVKPFSTAEAQVIRSYLNRLGDTIQLAIHLHTSFVPKKEFILYPWRYTLRQQSNYRTLQDIGEYAARQARLPDGRLYEVHQSSSDERVAGSIIDYISGVVGTERVFLIKPYHQPFPNFTDYENLDTYVNKALSAILGVVRGWRSSTKQNTLYFFGKEIEF